MPGNFKFGNKSEQSEKREWKKNYDFFDDENPVFFEWGNKVIKISRDSWSSDKGKGGGVRLQPGYINKKGEWSPSFKGKYPVPPITLPMTDDEELVTSFFKTIWAKFFPEE